jgi:hypothetical protein
VVVTVFLLRLGDGGVPALSSAIGHMASFSL